MSRLSAAAAFVRRTPATWAWPLAALLPSLGRRFLATDHAWRLILWFFVPALLLAWIGARFGWREEPKHPGPSDGVLPPRMALGLSLAILALASFVRVQGLASWPPFGLSFEEDEIGARALFLIETEGPWGGLLDGYGRIGEHKLTFAAAAAAFDLFGVSPFAMRLPFVLASIATPILFFFACRRLVAPDVALFPLLLLSTAWWPLAWGRVADEMFLPIPLQLAVVLLLLDFLDTAGPRTGFWLGLVSGLLAYEYTSFHLAPLVVLAVLALTVSARVLRRRRSGGAGPLWLEARLVAPGLAALALTWAILAQTQLTQPGGLSWFLGGVQGHRKNPSGLFAQGLAGLPGFVFEKMTAAFRLFADPADAYLVPGPPLADLLTLTAIVLLGGVAAATMWRRGHAIVAGWAALIMAGAVLLPGDLNLYRITAAVPFLFLLMALGLQVVWEALPGRRARLGFLVVLALFGTPSAAWNLHRFFGVVVRDPVLRANWSIPRTAIAERIRRLPTETPVIVLCQEEESSAMWGANVLEIEWAWLVHGWNVRVLHDPEEALRLAGPAGVLIVAFPEDRPDLHERIRATFPSWREGEAFSTTRYPMQARIWNLAPGARGGAR